MAWRQHLDFAPVPFVREQTSSKDDTVTSLVTGAGTGGHDHQDGMDVRKFYEEVVSTNCVKLTSNPMTRDVAKKIKYKKASKKGKKIENSFEEKDILRVDTCSFLRAAQNGDIEFLKKALKANMDIDTCDQYGWTALMCAAGGGHLEAVRFILSQGAQLECRDKSGKTAGDIAKKSRYWKIYNLCKNYQRSTIEDQHEDAVVEAVSSNHKIHIQSYFCNLCKKQFSTSESEHTSSTLHLFNLKLEPKPTTQYYIKPHNPGYRLMLRKGWNEEKGLGPQGQGHKFPIKTILKRDREGLGRCKKSTKARVTHFEAEDVKAVKPAKTVVRKETMRTVKKAAMKAKERKEKKMEIKFRQDFYD